MKKKFKNFYDSWKYISSHSIFINPDDVNKFLKVIGKSRNVDMDEFSAFNTLENCLCIDVVKVNPDTGEIDDNEKLNTKVEVWLECGGYMFDERLTKYIPCHDSNLDCGGDTFEEAIIELANLVYKYYKDYSISTVIVK